MLLGRFSHYQTILISKIFGLYFKLFISFHSLLTSIWQIYWIIFTCITAAECQLYPSYFLLLKKKNTFIYFSIIAVRVFLDIIINRTFLEKLEFGFENNHFELSISCFGDINYSWTTTILKLFTFWTNTTL